MGRGTFYWITEWRALVDSYSPSACARPLAVVYTYIALVRYAFSLSDQDWTLGPAYFHEIRLLLPFCIFGVNFGADGPEGCSMGC
jgi:hypothetical protein